MLRRAGAFTASLSLFALVGLAGCDKPDAKADAKADAKGDAKSDAKPDAKPEPGAEAKPGADSSNVLYLGAAKIMREGKPDRAIEIGADGKVNMAGKPFAVLSEVGELRDPQGLLMMTVNGDGSVVSDKGPTGITLSATGGTYTSDDLQIEIEFTAEGKIDTTVTGNNAGLIDSTAPALVTEGCTGTMTQTCALITLNYLMALGNPKSPRNE